VIGGKSTVFLQHEQIKQTKTSHPIVPRFIVLECFMNGVLMPIC